VAGAAIGAIASTMATSLYEHSLNRTQDTVAALRVAASRVRRRDRGHRADAADPAAGTAQGDQPTELLRPADPATTGLGSSDAPTAEVGSGGGPTRQDRRGRHDLAGVAAGAGRGAAGSAPTAIVFVLGLMVVTGLELLKGSTLIKGETGTSVGRVLERAPAEESTDPGTGTDRDHERPRSPAPEAPLPTAEPSATSRASRNAGPDSASSSAVPTTAAPPGR
jgi:hypothetical protein